MAQLSKKAKVVAKARKRFFVILLTWIAVLPVVILLQVITRYVVVVAAPALSFVLPAINVVSVVGLIYGLFGWIAVVIAAVYWENVK